MKRKSTALDDLDRKTRAFVSCQFLILGALVGLSLLNEVADLPHLLFGSPPTAAHTRWAEVGIEGSAFLIVAGIQVLFLQKLRYRIRILHGLMPVCRHCGRIDARGHWEPIEDYIRSNSEAFIHHTVCPECRRVHVALGGDDDLADTPRPAPVRVLARPA